MPFSVHTIRTDNGHEFQTKFDWHLGDLGIHHIYSSYTEASPVVIHEQPPAYVPSAPEPPVTQSSTEKIFVYPRLGQSEELQAKDRYECHSWAVSQTHYDPTKSVSGLPEARRNQMYADYRRAEDACLDGRGYTVK